jgi:hypothetical protein
MRSDIIRWWVRYDKINDPNAKYQFYNTKLGTLCAETKTGDVIELARCVQDDDSIAYTITDIKTGNVLRKAGQYSTPNFNYGSIIHKVYQNNLIGLIQFYMLPNQYLNHVLAQGKAIGL